MRLYCKLLTAFTVAAIMHLAIAFAVKAWHDPRVLFDPYTHEHRRIIEEAYRDYRPTPAPAVELAAYP